MKRINIFLAGLMTFAAASAQTAPKFGDLNADEAINILDATLLVEPILNSVFGHDYDINGDGRCNVSDITCLVDYILRGGAPERPVPCVDLGLSVVWAAYNLGAASPEQAGNYYAWGETSTKETYTSDNSLTYDKSMTQLMAQGIIGSDGDLAPDYDAATAALGDEWRMPTKAEVAELLGCTWENCDDYFPILGIKVTGPNGVSIFLPEAGQKRDANVIDEGFYGYFWSATSDEMADAFNESKGIGLSFTSKNLKWVNSDARYVGRPIRPVKVNNESSN